MQRSSVYKIDESWELNENLKEEQAVESGIQFYETPTCEGWRKEKKLGQ